MRRNFTVYGLRFSKTSFWNRLNTGFPDPAVATVLTACGIETVKRWKEVQPLISCCNSTYRLRYWNSTVVNDAVSIGHNSCNSTYRLRYWNLKLAMLHLQECSQELQQYLPLAVLKRFFLKRVILSRSCCNSTYRLRYWNGKVFIKDVCSASQLQQYLPLAVLKPPSKLPSKLSWMVFSCNSTYRLRYWNILGGVWTERWSIGVATVLTACGIETNTKSSNTLI